MLERKKRIPKINDILSINDGFFKRMNYDFELIDSSKLDFLFVASFGQKSLAPLFDLLVEYDFATDKFTLSEENKQLVSDTILSFYKYNWDKMKAVMKIDYDPIRNFSDDVTELISDVDKKSSDLDNTIKDTGTGSKTRTDNLINTETRNLSGSENGDTTYLTQGFNSSSYQNKDKDTDTRTTIDSGTITNENTGTQKNSEERNFSSTKKLTELVNDTYNRERTLSRIGNIGNITTQKMLNEEIELWKWNFIRQIIEDVKNITTIQIYS